jgi:phage repressor protein C with HTH and peptisase S24 domain
MNKFEIRRLNLVFLKDTQCKGKISVLAEKLNKDATYIGRCLYPEGKKHKKNIADEILDAVYTAFKLPPGWCDIPQWGKSDNGCQNKLIDIQPIQSTDNLLDQNENNFCITSDIEWLGSLEPYESGSPLLEEEIALPYFREVELGAGSGRYEVQENHGRKIRFPMLELKSRGIQPEYAACVTVSGNSMWPAYPHGCILGIDTSKTEIKDGDHYAIDHNGHLRVKILYLLPDGGLRLRSFNNDEWPDERLSKEEKLLVKVIGRVFWSSGFR